MDGARRDEDWTDLEAEGLPATDEQPPGIGPETAQEGTFPPRDPPIAVESFRTTQAEEDEGESLEQRAAHELPDELSEEEPVLGRLADPGIDDDMPSLSSHHPDGEELADWSDDDEGLSAEESAIHIIED